MNRKEVFISIIFFIAIGSFSLSPIASAKHYFVATNGNDEHSGSLDEPFQTIQHAIDVSSLGDTIFVRQGTYFELINIYNKEEGNGTLTVQPFENEKVIIDGSKRDLQSSKRAAFSIRDSAHITIKGIEIRHITSNDRNFYPAGILIRGNSKHITIENNTIHHIANTNSRGNAHGILVYGDSPTAIEHVTIRDNTLHNLTLGRSESLTVSGNVNHFTIASNYLHHNNNIGIDIAGHYGACTEVGCIDIARNGKVTGNIVKNHSSAHNVAYGGDNSAAGIYVDGGENIVVEFNYVTYNNYGISIASENKQQYAKNILVRRNFIINNQKAGLVLGGSSIDSGGTQSVQIERNIFIENDTLQKGYREITIQQNNVSTLLKGNTYYTAHPHYINDRSKTPQSILYENERPFNIQFMLFPFKRISY